MGEIVFILIILFTIVRSLFLFFRWAMRGLTRLSAPRPNDMPEAAPPEAVLPPRPPLQPQRPQAAPARRPDFGGSLVTREATSASFRAEEEQLLRSEPQRASATAQVDGAAASPSDTRLFQDPGDFIRAVILQEALGPPLSRRQRH